MNEWTTEELQRTEWFGPLLQRLKEEFDRLTSADVDQRPALERECQAVRTKIAGWRQSLANPDLNPGVRALVERDLGQALETEKDLERAVAEIEACRHQLQPILDPQRVVDRLNRLGRVLAESDPSRTNLDLSLHIDSIRCFPAGRVVVRTCQLGALPEAIDRLATADTADHAVRPATADPGVDTATPRRRARRRVDNRDTDGSDLRAAARMAVDVHRFAGLDPSWFWDDELHIPPRTCWAKANAAAVAAKKAETAWSVAKLATFFGKSGPTIRAALRYAAGPSGDTGPPSPESAPPPTDGG
jgi:hypothetical protein